MEDQIIQLLRVTFSGTNQEIRNAEALLSQNIANPTFFQSLANIISNCQVDDSIRKAAILYLNTIINSFWNKETLPLSIKQNIILFVSQLLLNFPPALFSIYSHLAQSLIKLAFFNNEWPDLLNLISTGFQGEENLVLRSLILSNSLSKLLSKNDVDHNFSLQFASNIIPVIGNILETRQNLQLFSIGYNCVSHLSNIQEIFSNETLLISLKKMIHFSSCLNDVTNNQFFETFAKKVMKFLSKFVILIDGEFINMILPLIGQIMNSALSNGLKCHSLRLLYNIYKNDNFINANGQEAFNTLISFVFPLFSLSEDEVEMAQNDPLGFISETQKICDDFNDPKASASFILYDLAKKYNMLIPLCLFYLNNSFQMYLNKQTNWMNLFSMFHMCSSIINLAASKNNQEIVALFHNLSPLFQISEDPFATASVLMLLSHANKLKLSAELIGAVFTNIDNPFQLTQYYAIECISSVLRQISKNPSLKEEIFTQYGQNLEKSLQVLINASSNGNNVNLTESFMHYFSVFGQRLLPFSHNLASHFIGVINNICDDSEAFSTLFMSIESLSSLMKIVYKSDEVAINVCPFVYHSLLQILPKIPKTVIDSYFSLLNQIVIESPFNPEYWEVVTLFNNEMADYFCQIFEFLIFADQSFNQNNTAIHFLLGVINNAITQTIEIDDFLMFCPAITGFVLKMPEFVNSNNEFLNSLIQKIIPILQCYSQLNQNEDIDDDDDGMIISENILKLLNALLIVASTNVANICGDSFSYVLLFWQQHPQFPMFIPASLKMFTNFNDGQKSDLISIIVNLCFTNIIAKSEIGDFDSDDMDFDDDDDLKDESEICTWFSKESIISSVQQLINENQNNNLFVKCNKMHIEAIMQYGKPQE
ncbi:hypothetical protein TRFO_24070 [Tritrichomonas foetus]|uniref:Importin N-terminal domain-containing protein n=1 Tax=Tritrichomonas foetus TaxID=1144522 RepID=A0A1J4KDX4_9EUKA|nr:hypothetical protein TRFO_24070 [Tritrichomonas foetus]|eukprot:OHT07661.1 hypothetical protein TRFO_24070 [Tritrichomonas foetus]